MEWILASLELTGYILYSEEKYWLGFIYVAIMSVFLGWFFCKKPMILWVKTICQVEFCP